MKTRQVFLLESAVRDIESARLFYQGMEASLGDEFYQRMLEQLETLKERGGIHPKQWDCHGLIANRFPFAVYYKIVPRVVTVSAVLHMRGDVGAIRGPLL